MIGPKEALEIIRFKLSRSRFKHSIQVANTAREMAARYGFDEERAYLTGLLHDYAKGISGQELIDLAEDYGIELDPIDREVPDLLHGPVGACLLADELDIDDQELLHAVSAHTLGCLDMNDLDKIIYLADMIEPGRDYPVWKGCLPDPAQPGLRHALRIGNHHQVLPGARAPAIPVRLR